MLMQLTPKPLYSSLGDQGTGLPSCSAFLMAMVGCIRSTSIEPATAPIAVCSMGLRLSAIQ